MSLEIAPRNSNHIPDGTAQALIEDSPISRCLIQSCEQLINVMIPTSRIPTSALASLHNATCSREARFGFP